MARLIVKSPYIQCGKQNAGSYLRYIATRERVEIIPDDRPPTRKQEQLITKLAKDFPDVKELLEYEDYVQKPTKANASSLITLALEEHWKQVQQTDGYLKYIATRPRAERLGDHGLFGDADHVDLDAAMSELGHYTGNVWTHILSMHREDAERLGYNNAQAWRALLRAHRNDIAAAMHIPPQDFRWYAAFRNEGHHPHIHMMAWSVKPGQAHLDRDGIRSIRSQLTNDIFQQELLHVYEQKSVSRDELVKESRKVMLELSRQMRDTICEHTQAEQMIWKLSQQLGEVKGKKSYGYLPRPMKRQVGEIVDQLEQIPIVNECYQKWWELQCQVNEFYSGKKQQRPRCQSRKSSGPSGTRSSGRRRKSVWARSPSRTRRWKSGASGWKTGRSPTIAYGCGPGLKAISCHWSSEMRQQRIWNGWRSTVTSTLSTSWDCCTGTAACCCQTQNERLTGWSWRQDEICQQPSMLSASCTSQAPAFPNTMKRPRTVSGWRMRLVIPMLSMFWNGRSNGSGRNS